MDINMYMQSHDNSKLDYIASCIENIKKRNGYLNAVVHEFDVKPSIAGRLMGAPIIVKDVICYGPTTVCSKILKHFKPEYNATVAQKLVDAGATILGKANCDEFCMGSDGSTSMFGPAIHPFIGSSNEQYLPGGSSSGSAVAVAAGMCIGALASDTGGSIRLPACLVGAVGYRPSFCRVSRFGVVAFGSSYDQVGVISMDVATTREIASVISGPDKRDPLATHHGVTGCSVDIANITLHNNRPKIAMIRDLKEDKNVESAFNDAVKLLSDVCDIESIQIPFNDVLQPTYQALAFAEATSNLAQYDHIRYKNDYQDHADYFKDAQEYRSDNLGDVVLTRLGVGAYMLSEAGRSTYDNAINIRIDMIKHFNQLWEKYDFIIHPTITSSQGMKYNAGVICVHSDIDLYLSIAAHIKAPSITLPIGLSKYSPIGFSILAPYLEDDKMFDFAAYCEHRFDLAFQARKNIASIIASKAEEKTHSSKVHIKGVKE